MHNAHKGEELIERGIGWHRARGAIYRASPYAAHLFILLWPSLRWHASTRCGPLIHDISFEMTSMPDILLGPKLIFVTGLVKFVTAVAILVCPDMLGKCLSGFANI